MRILNEPERLVPLVLLGSAIAILIAMSSREPERKTYEFTVTSVEKDCGSADTPRYGPCDLMIRGDGDALLARGDMQPNPIPGERWRFETETGTFDEFPTVMEASPIPVHRR